jgi:predicted transcriptional regulator
MARPKAAELTERELELMHVFWEHGPQTAADAREQLAAGGRDLAYTTVATLVKILIDKGFLEQQGEKRPFVYHPLRTFDDVSKRLVGDLVNRVFQGSREELLVRLLDGRKLTKKEREVLEQILAEGK